MDGPLEGGNMKYLQIILALLILSLLSACAQPNSQAETTTSHVVYKPIYFGGEIGAIEKMTQQDGYLYMQDADGNTIRSKDGITWEIL